MESLKNNKKLIVAVLLFGVLCFAFGRYLTPEKIKIEKEIVQKEDTTKKQDESIQIEKDKKKKTTVIEIIRPDGTKETKTVINEDESTKKSKEKHSEEQTKKELVQKETTEIENSHSFLTISGLIGTDVVHFSLSNQLVYGGHIHKNLIGPLDVGVFGLSSGVVGFSLGITFK